jgi:O-antigen ligase
MAHFAGVNPQLIRPIRHIVLDAPTGITVSHGLRALAILILFISGLVDLPRAIQLGPVTSQAIFTIVYFIAGIPLFLISPVRGRGFGVVLLPLIVFWLWSVTSLAWSSAPLKGTQNVLVVGVTLILMLASSAIASVDLNFAPWLQRNLWRSVIVVAIIYFLAILWFGPGSNEIFGARSFSLYALFGVGYQLARWHYGARSGLAWAIGITILIGFSQSRLALGIAIALFPLAQLPTKGGTRILKMICVSIAVLAASYGALLYFDSLRERFVSGDVSVKLGPIIINGSGRNAFWQTTMQSFWEAPILGQGAGSAEGLIDSYWVNIQHPHSDYLRIAHDYGLVGLAAWLCAVLTLLVMLRRNWRSAEKSGPKFATIQLTAFLALVSYSLQMSMENAFVYVYVSAPLGLLVGSALGIHGAMSVRANQRIGGVEPDSLSRMSAHA